MQELPRVGRLAVQCIHRCVADSSQQPRGHYLRGVSNRLNGAVKLLDLSRRAEQLPAINATCDRSRGRGEGAPPVVLHALLCRFLFLLSFRGSTTDWCRGRFYRASCSLVATSSHQGAGRSLVTMHFRPSRSRTCCQKPVGLSIRFSAELGCLFPR